LHDPSGLSPRAASLQRLLPWHAGAESAFFSAIAETIFGYTDLHFL
jgi:hypothetical protein